MKTTGLTIQQAIQSGLPFKRELDEFYHTNNERIKYTFTHTALIAQDWQIKLPEVTITREKLAEAWDRQVAIVQRIDKSDKSKFFEDFCKELGL